MKPADVVDQTGTNLFQQGEPMERDRAGEPFQDDFTDNRGPAGPQQEDEAERETLDPDVDSQAGDHAMENDVFGVNEPGPKK
jgi:hypothetical protein